MSSFFAVEVHRGTKIHNSKKGEKETKRMLAMAQTDIQCTIGTKIETKVMHVPSMAEFSRSYGANKKARIIVGTVLEVEIGLKTTVLGTRRTFVFAQFDLGGVDMMVATINIRSVKIHTPEPTCPATVGDG